MSRIVKTPDERRQELLGIGLELYMQNGASGVSIKEVVGRADVATGLFYYYFKSKEQFIEEALNSYIDGSIGKMSDILQSEALTIMQKIEQGINAFWEHMAHMEPFMQDEVLHSESHHVLSEKILCKIQPIIQTLIEKGNNEGLFNVEDSNFTAYFLAFGLSGILHANMEIKLKSKEKIADIIFTMLGIDKRDDSYD